MTRSRYFTLHFHSSWIQTLFQANVLSVPVLDKDGKVVGLLDMNDIVFFALSICKTSQELGKYFGGLSEEQQQVCICANTI